MVHNRKLVIGGVALTTKRLPVKQNAFAANRVRDEIEQEIIQSGYLDGAPFKWVGLLIRYGLIDETEPHYQKISHKHGDLPLAIEVNINRLINSTDEEIENVYRIATLISLRHAGKKYNLNINRINEILLKYNILSE